MLALLLTVLLWESDDSLLLLMPRRPPITHQDRLSSNVRERLSDLWRFLRSLVSSSVEDSAVERSKNNSDLKQEYG